MNLGIPLNTILKNNKIIDIILIIDNKKTNFLNTIRNKSLFLRNKHIDNIVDFDDSYKFYLLKDMNYYVLAIKDEIEKIRWSCC